LLHEGEALPLEVIAVRTDETPTPEPVSVEAQLTLIDWQTNRVEGQDEDDGVPNEPKFVPLAKRTLRPAADHQKGDRWQIGKTEILSLSCSKSRANISSNSPRRMPPAARWSPRRASRCTESARPAWDYRTLSGRAGSERTTYTAGETAKILVKTPISGDALVTVERERVLVLVCHAPRGNAPVIEVPMQPGDAPNVFVSVMLLRGRRTVLGRSRHRNIRIGYCELTGVPIPRRSSRCT
jgi:hypothetical protein